MVLSFHRCGALRWIVPALAVLLASAGVGHAAWLGLRNDLSAPVIIQGGIVANDRIVLGRPQLLYPGEVSWESIVQPGNRIITIYDAKTRRMLYQDAIRCNGDLFYSMQPNPPIRAKLVPAKMPKERPSRPPR